MSAICRGAADDPAPAAPRPAAPRYRFLFFARFLMKAPGRRYDCSVAEARRALAELPQAREWMHFAWLTGGSWMPGDDDEVAADEGGVPPGAAPRGVGVGRRALAGSSRCPTLKD